MTNFIKHTIEKFNINGQQKICCLEANYISQTECFFRYLILKKEKNILKILSQNEFLSGDNISNSINQRIPIILIINGKGVITRKILNSDAINIYNTIQTILPNVNIDDFYFQIAQINENESLLVIIRKNTIEDVIAILQKYKLSIIDLNIGASSINYILPFIEDRATICTSYLEFHIKNKEITDFSLLKKDTECFPLFFGNSKLIHTDIVCFSAGIKFYTNQIDPANIELPQITSLKKEFKYKHWFRVIGLSYLIIFFTLLFINFFVFSNKRKQQEKLFYELQSYNFMFARIDSLELELNNKKQLLEQTDLLKPSMLSFYADRLMKFIPSGVQLNLLDVFPLEIKRHKKIDVEISKNSIIIAGQSTNSHLLNSYIKSIKEYSWVNDVEILEYNQKQYDLPIEFKFRILIK